MSKDTAWSIVTFASAADAPKTLLLELANANIAIAVLKNAISPAKCAHWSSTLEDYGATENKYSNAILSTYGVYLANSLKAPVNYHSRANTFESIFEGQSHKPVTEIQEKLGKLLSADTIATAKSDDGHLYAPMVGRKHGIGVSNPLHSDSIGRDAASYSVNVAVFDHQLSAVLCLEECDEGGELMLYRKKWSKDDEVFKIKNGLGYYDQLVRDVKSVTFRPRTGDLYVFNPIYFHEILEVSAGTRTTIGQFIGWNTTNPQNLKCWA